ncbi:hypothetical protein TWF481_006494 [Arthrobotrys musiformis]|uniref:C2H2-type domain-containing protein n=1 Tax=Arthrobotrys musiformis TaxID=47236 RepID=A0AAV9WAL7_9PEZI
MSCDFVPAVQGSWQRWQSFPSSGQASGQHGMHHRVQSTNMLFPSNVDPIAQVPRNGLRVSPSEARAARAAQPSGITIEAGRRSSVLSDGNPSFLFGQQPPPSQPIEHLRNAQTNARGLHAGFEILPMFGDKPPQASRSSPRLGSNGASASSYNLGFGFGSDMQSHYSFRPDVGRAMCGSEVDESMAEWEQELFQSYRKMKYYGEEELSKEQTVEIVTKFTAAAREAWVKLETAAKSDQVTQGFKVFFKSIRSFEHLTRLGFQNLDQVLEGKTPTSLIPIYSVLHVAYAISQTTSSSIPQLSQPLAVSTFCADAQKRWKKCLKSGPNSLGFSEEGVFDELLAVMTQEIDAALEWISTRTCMTAWTNVDETDDESESHSYLLSQTHVTASENNGYQHQQSSTSLSLQGSAKCHQMGLPPERQPGRAQWDVVMSGPMFAHILAFLENLPKLGSMMSRLSFPTPQPQQLSGPNLQTRPPCQTVGDFKTSLLKFIISQIWGKQKFNWVGHIMRAAINMVQYGAIQCLRDFEDYVVGLTKFCEEVPKRLDFLDSFLDICVTFAPMFTDLQVRKGQTPYCTGYRNARLRLERATMLSRYQARRHSMQMRLTGSPLRAMRANSISNIPVEHLRLQLPFMDLSSEAIPSNSPPQLSPTGSFSSGTLSEATSLAPSVPAAGSPSLSISTLGDALGSKTTSDSIYDFLVPTNSWNSQQVPYQATRLQEACQGMSVSWPQAYGSCQITAPTTIADIVSSITASSTWDNTIAATAHPDFAPITGFTAPDEHDISDLIGQVSDGTPESIDDALSFSDAVPRNARDDASQDMETDSDPVATSTATTSPRGIRPRRAPRSKKAPGGRIFICDFPGCGAEIRGAKYTQSNSNLLRHQRSSHGLGGSVGTEFTCEVAGCVAKYRGARARENLKTHMKNKHGIRTKALRKGGRQSGSNMPLEVISEDESS